MSFIRIHPVARLCPAGFFVLKQIIQTKHKTAFMPDA